MAPNNEATKHDQGKPPIGLVPRSAVEAEARVMGFGAEKYGRDNWRKGFLHSRLIDAALRHIFTHAEGHDIDPESGLLHLAHARCCLAFLIEFIEKGLGTDDRPKSSKVSVERRDERDLKRLATARPEEYASAIRELANVLGVTPAQIDIRITEPYPIEADLPWGGSPSPVSRG